MSHYGCTVTKAGRELLAKLMASKLPLVITNVMVGSGKCPDELFPSDLTGLIQPIAQGTSTVPTYSGDTINMTVEYRSDMNGGLQQGFWLNEFSIQAQDPDGGQVMLFYGTLGDYPVWVSAFANGTVDVRRFPVSITIGDGAEVQVNYNPGSFMTASDVDEAIQRHNADQNAHEAKFHVITTRTRSPEKPDYGLGGGGEAEVLLEVSPYTGDAEVSVIVNGTAYNADNMSTYGETAESGTLIINKMEE